MAELAAGGGLFAELPAELGSRLDPQRPWQLLSDPLAEVLAALPSQRLGSPMPPDAHLAGDHIVIGRGVRIHPGAVIEGPIRIGDDCEIGPGAWLHGGCWLGDGCTVGAGGELRHAILLDGAILEGRNHVADAMIGAGCRLRPGAVVGSGSCAGEAQWRGSLLGDGVALGANAVITAGVVVPAGARVSAGTVVGG